MSQTKSAPRILGAPPLSQRLVRAAAYTFCFSVVMGAAYYFEQNRTTFSLSDEDTYHVLYTVCICFATAVAYVNTYIYFPNYGKTNSRSYQKDSALRVRSVPILVIALFVLPTLAYSSMFARTPDLANPGFQRFLFVVFCLTLPAARYSQTLYKYSSRFYGKHVLSTFFHAPKDDIELDPKLFWFRYQVITPGMILVFVPFCIMRVVYGHVSMLSAALAVGYIEMTYWLITHWRTGTLWSFGGFGKPIDINNFFLFNLILFFLIWTLPLYDPQLAFVTFGIWIALYFAAFEYLAVVYAKTSEVRIREACLHPKREITGDMYAKYFSAGALAFSFLAVCFPLSFLLTMNSSYWLVVVTMVGSIVAWFYWLLRASKGAEYKNLFEEFNRYKWFVLFIPVAIILTSHEFFQQWKPGFDFGLRGTLIELSVAIVSWNLVLPSISKEKFNRSSMKTFYLWLGAIGLGLTCPILGALSSPDNDRGQQLLALAWAYFFAQVLVTCMMIFFERDLIRKSFVDDGKDPNPPPCQ